jgi:hypothetical protein
LSKGLWWVADVEKVVASGHLVPRGNLDRRRILCLISAFVAKITAEGLGEGLSEVLSEGLAEGLTEG